MSALGTKAQVIRGANFLDEHLPGWAGKINKKTIKMCSNTFCILGQLAKDKGYEDALSYGEELGLSDAKFLSHGFEAEGVPTDDKMHAELWKAEIDKRLTVEPKAKKANVEPKKRAVAV